MSLLRRTPQEREAVKAAEESASKARLANAQLQRWQVAIPVRIFASTIDSIIMATGVAQRAAIEKKTCVEVAREWLKLYE